MVKENIPRAAAGNLLQGPTAIAHLLARPWIHKCSLCLFLPLSLSLHELHIQSWHEANIKAKRNVSFQELLDKIVMVDPQTARQLLGGRQQRDFMRASDTSVAAVELLEHGDRGYGRRCQRRGLGSAVTGISLVVISGGCGNGISFRNTVYNRREDTGSIRRLDVCDARPGGFQRARAVADCHLGRQEGNAESDEVHENDVTG